MVGRLDLVRRLPQEGRDEHGEHERHGVQRERHPPVLGAERPAETEQHGGRDRRRHHLVAEVALALSAVEVVGEHRRAARHDRGLGEADDDPTADDERQGRQVQRRRARDRVDHERADEEPLAADAVDDAAGDQGRETDHERRNRDDHRRQRRHPGGVGERLLNPRQVGRHEHGREHGHARARQQDPALEGAGGPTGAGVGGDWGVENGFGGRG